MAGIAFRGPDSNGGKPASGAGKFFLSLFFLFFFAIGSFFEVVIIREFARALGQRSWRPIPCKVVSSEVQERSDSESPFVFTIRYSYDRGGRTYTGSMYKRNYKGSEKYTDAQRLVERFPSGLATSCYVNSQKPAEAVLARDSLLIGLVIFFPAIFVVIGAGGIYFTWRGRGKNADATPIAAPIARVGRKKEHAMVAFFAVFGLVGLAMLYPLGIKPIARTLDAESWVTTPCKVLRGEVRSHSSDDGTTYSVYLLYEYEFDGRTYKSDRYDFMGGSSSGRRGKARVVEQYKTAASPVCYVNPVHPSDAVLKRGFHAKLLLALFPLPFILVGVGGIIHTWRGKRRSGSISRPWMPQPRQGVAGDDLSALRLSDAGPAVLEPRYSPWGKLLGAVLIAAFWNGIVSVFVVQVVNGFRHGGPNWFMTLFMLPFVAVGLGLLGFIVYQFLALFNPRPTLQLSSATIPLGGAAELQWRFSGRTSRIGELTVVLRAIEQATYRRGTRTCTDKSTFCAMELYRTANTADITAGQVGFVLPHETMHSFEADNNKIIWSLDVHGDIKRWPDVKESFPITVVPAAG